MAPHTPDDPSRAVALEIRTRFVYEKPEGEDGSVSLADGHRYPAVRDGQDVWIEIVDDGEPQVWLCALSPTTRRSFIPKER